MYSLYSSVWKWLLSLWPQTANWGELWDFCTTYLVFPGSSFLPSKGRKELITNSFEIHSFELWLPSNWAGTRFIVTDLHRLFGDNIPGNGYDLVHDSLAARTFHKMPTWLKSSSLSLFYNKCLVSKASEMTKRQISEEVRDMWNHLWIIISWPYTKTDLFGYMNASIVIEQLEFPGPRKQQFVFL